MKNKLFILALVAFCAMPIFAKVVLPTHFTNNMVLQQKTTLRIPGKAQPNTTITVSANWTKKQFTTQTDSQGKFSIEMTTPKAGGPYTLTFNDGEITQLNNVLIGEVWLGGGQSNMQMEIDGSWAKVLNYEEETANANYPKIRLLSIDHVKSMEPLENAKIEHGTWLECTPENIKTFSACCYFFARKLWQELHIPIGVIEDCVGGTTAEYWTRTEVLASIKGFEKDAQINMQLNNAKAEIILSQFDSIARADDPGIAAQWYLTNFDDSQWKTMSIPCRFESKIGNYDGSVWFRKHITIPAGWVGKQLTINVGVVDDGNTTYFNGVEVGRVTKYPSKGLYTIPASLVKSTNNIICVRVYDSGGHGGISDKAENLYLACDNNQLSLASDWKYQLGVKQENVPSLARPYDRISCHWNGMIAPITGFPIRGVIWYQGESNQGRAAQYEPLFQALIQDWRLQFNQPNMPFHFVQIANHRKQSDLQPNAEWPFIREAQAKATCLDGVHMTSAIDIGEANDIHPRNKQEVGLRLALLALRYQYGKNVICTAPLYKGYSIKGNEVHIQFSMPEGSEPFLQSDSLPGFIMAGRDQQWHVAKARTQGQEVVVTCDDVPQPIAVRYGWADNPNCTLTTKHHFPVFPFRTDAW